jgi:hypothetical protein
MNNNQPLIKRFNQNLGERIKQIQKPKEREELFGSALSLTSKLIYTLELSWGGPADGFKLIVDQSTGTIEDIKYYYSDWFEYHEQYLPEELYDKLLPHFESLI